MISQKGSHVKLQSPEGKPYMFGFHDDEEIGSVMLPGLRRTLV